MGCQGRPGPGRAAGTGEVGRLRSLRSDGRPCPLPEAVRPRRRRALSGPPPSSPAEAGAGPPG